MFFGLTIVIIGLVFLLKNLGLIGSDVWPIIWPSLVIILGLSILLKRKRHRDKWDKLGEGVRKVGKEMHKTFGGEE